MHAEEVVVPRGLSPSPSPPPQLATRCPRCLHSDTLRRLGSATSATTTLNSYTPANEESCPATTRRRSVLGLMPTPAPTCHDDEEDVSWAGNVLLEREMLSLHRAVPALRRRDLDTQAIRQRFYPEGGWGWLVCAAGFLAHLLSSGLQLAHGLLAVYAALHLHTPARGPVDTAWVGAVSLAVSLLTAPLTVAVCRRKSTRLTAVLGGLVMALACLFTSFARHFHQVLLSPPRTLISYGVLLGIGAGIVRETSSLMLGHYFKRRREFVEMVVQAGAGVGVALFSVLYKEAIGKLQWRLGLQACTGVLCLAFFIGMLYRSASLYHPHRRAIVHLKNQRRKIKEKKKKAAAVSAVSASVASSSEKPPLLDLSPLRVRAVRRLVLAAATASLGLYTPVFFLAVQGFKEGLEPSALALIQTFFGFATALGCMGFGAIIVRPTEQCLVSRQYLCQAALLGVGISLLALSAVQGYHGYVLFVWLYGVCLGGCLYSLKMYTMEQVRARHFTRAWGLVQGAEALPVLIGVPITGFINETHPKAGYYFSFASTILGAALLFLVGGDYPGSGGGPLQGSQVPPVPPPPPSGLVHVLDVPYRSMGCLSSLAKSNSLAAMGRYPSGCLGPDHCPALLRPSKSVPEGLAIVGNHQEWISRPCSRASLYAYPRHHLPMRNITVIEQITTSV